MSRSAILLAAHGARRDPAAGALVRRLARQLHAAGAADEVLVGFHQEAPGFAAALDGSAADRVLVIPLFTAQGYYTEQVLPAALARSARARHVRLHQSRPVGAHPALGPLVEARAARLIAEHGLDPAEVAVVVVGHGTRRHPRSRETALALADRLVAAGLAAAAGAAFLDDAPRIAETVATLPHRQLLVLPFLLGGGEHASRDLPAGVGLPGTLGLDVPLVGETGGRRIVVDVPLGGYPELGELLLAIAREELPPELPVEPLAAGTVALIGAGPGDPGLITVRGLTLLRSADVVLHDRLIPHELLAETRFDALVLGVGKQAGGGTPQQDINALLVAHAVAGRRVVRLKGGDPYVFGRGSEELDACRAAGVPCEVVPGISSAIAVPAAAGIPVTARGEARSFTVITAQTEGGRLPDAVAALAGNAATETLVLLMGRGALREATAVMLAAGRDPATPAACIAQGTTAAQRVTVATLATIADAAERDGLEAPVVTVIGTVAARAAGTAAFPAAACA